MTDVRATQLGIEAWVQTQNTAPERITQIGVEAWISQAPENPELVTQLGIERWDVHGFSPGNQIQLTQIGIEAWISTKAALFYGGCTVRHAFLVMFDFLSGPVYVWQGFRPLVVDGITWNAVGPLATVGQVEDAISDNAPTITLRISGVSASLIAKALEESSEVRGQLAYIYDIFFDDDWQPTGSPSVYAVVRMDTVKISNNRNPDGSRDQAIEVACEHFLTNGPNPPFGRYSSADQSARHGDTSPPDLYFQYMAINQNRRQRWPTF